MVVVVVVGWEEDGIGMKRVEEIENEREFPRLDMEVAKGVKEL